MAACGRRVSTLTVTLLLLLLCSDPALAWAPETRVHLVDEAVRLMPTSLRTVLENHRREVLRGLLEPLAAEDSAAHRPGWGGGTLDDQVAVEAEALRTVMQGDVTMAQIAKQFGAIAHYVTDAGFPPGVSRGDGDSRYTHFSEFCESRRERFPVVFYGHDTRLIVTPDFKRFTVRLLDRASSEDEELARAYAAAGDPPNPAAFDDRSVPFAVGSLAYSHTFTDVVNAWLAAWHSAGGDMGRTPYLDPTILSRSPAGSGGRP